MLILKIVLLLLRQSLEFSRKDKYNIFTRFLYSPSSLRLKLVCKMWTHSTFESCDKGQTTTIIRWKADIARAYQLGRCSTVNGIQLKIGTTVHIFESFHFLKILSPHLLIKRYQQDRTTDYILEHAFVVLKKSKLNIKYPHKNSVETLKLFCVQVMYPNISHTTQVSKGCKWRSCIGEVCGQIYIQVVIHAREGMCLGFTLKEKRKAQ